MKTNQPIRKEHNCAAPAALLIFFMFIIALVATSCKTDKQTTHFTKVEHHVKYKKVTGYKPTKRVVRKCYAYE
jgi:hypothetical protein